MAVCEVCNKEMLNGGSCTAVPFRHKFKYYQPLRFGETDSDLSYDGNCPDCNVKFGGYHHVGCDTEVCPICHGQALGCPCMDEEEDRVTFEKYCGKYGLLPTDFEQIFLVGREFYKLIGLNPRAKTFTLYCVNIKDTEVKSMKVDVYKNARKLPKPI